jgi:hypothetical protein
MQALLISALPVDKGECSISGSGRFILQERARDH